MKKLVAALAVLLSLGLLAAAILIGPIHPRYTIVMPAPFVPPAYVMPTLKDAQGSGETALGVRNAILTDDFAAAKQALETELTKDDPQSDDVFNFLELIAPRNSPEYPAALAKWIQQDPASNLPYMLRAEYYYDTGLLFRGYGFVDEVPPERLAAFSVYIALANKDLVHVRASGDHSPWLYSMLMQIAKYVGDQQQEQALFDEAVKYNPNYYALYDLRLSSLTPKWGGSLQAMGAFVNHYSTVTPAHPRFRMLSVDLYFHLLRDRGVNCLATGDASGDCFTQMGDFLLSAPVQKDMNDVISYYAHTNLYALNKQIMYDFCFCSADNIKYEKSLVDMLAQASGETNYAVDYLRSEMASFYGRDGRTAISFGKKALDEAQSFSFPTESDRKATLAELNEALYTATLALQDFPQAIHYAMAAVANDRTNYRYQSDLCTAYFRGGQLNEAIVNCSASLAIKDNSYAREMRADAYINKQMRDKAAEDFRAELSYNEIYRGEDRGRILFQLAFLNMANKRYQDQLKLFADYPELLEEKAPNRSRLYAWRCEAYAGVGDLGKALADCDASLKIDYSHDVAAQREKIIAAGKPQPSIIPPVSIMAAIDAGQQDLAKKLVLQGDSLSEKDAYDHTLLMEAIDKAEWPVAALLIEHNADSAHPVDDEGQDALFHAVVTYCGKAWYMCPEHPDNPDSLGVIESLLKGGADPQRQTNNGKAALIQAAFLCEAPVVKTMLTHGAEIDYHEKFSGWTPLLAAATSCGEDMVSLLLQYHPHESQLKAALETANKRSSTVGPYGKDVEKVIAVLKSANGQ